MTRFSRAALCVLSLLPASLLAQRRPAARPRAAAVERAAAAITEADIHATIFTLADDSMLGRPTPSPQLEETAQYVAARFRSFGLQPGGDSGWFQHYPVLRVAVDSTSNVTLNGGTVHLPLVVGRDLAFGGRDVAPVSATGPVVLMWGAPADSAHPFGTQALRGATILYVAPSGFGGRRGLAALQQAARTDGAAAWITITDFGAAAFASQAQLALRPREILGGMEQAGALATFTTRDNLLAPVLAAASVDVVTLRTAAQGGIKPLDGFTATVDLRRAVVGRDSAPNVIGVLPGSDPALRGEYVFFTGHMDHVGAVGPGRVNVGCRAAGADSICNGADDDASGTTTVIELAKAFSTMNPHPRRTLVFMTVSGEERGLWGSGYYSEHPRFPLDSTVADLNTDMVGRYYNNQPGWKDTIVAIGKEHSDLGAAANRVVAAHPELHMNLIDDIWPQEQFYFRSDHYNFARKGVPILFFFNGTHPDYHQPTDSPDKIDTEKMMRIARMVFYLGLDVANADQKPQWNPDSRRRIVENATP